MVHNLQFKDINCCKFYPQKKSGDACKNPNSFPWIVYPRIQCSVRQCFPTVSSLFQFTGWIQLWTQKGHVKADSGLIGLIITEVERCVVLPFDGKPGNKVPIQMKGVMDCFPAYSHKSGSFTGQSKRPFCCPKSLPVRSLEECSSRKEKTPMCQVLYMGTSGAATEVHGEVMEMLQVSGGATSLVQVQRSSP